jgi:hypothetical protein
MNHDWQIHRVNDYKCSRCQTIKQLTSRKDYCYFSSTGFSEKEPECGDVIAYEVMLS